MVGVTNQIVGCHGLTGWSSRTNQLVSRTNLARLRSCVRQLVGVQPTQLVCSRLRSSGPGGSASGVPAASAQASRRLGSGVLPVRLRRPAPLGGPGGRQQSAGSWGGRLAGRAYAGRVRSGRRVTRQTRLFRRLRCGAGRGHRPGLDRGRDASGTARACTPLNVNSAAWPSLDVHDHNLAGLELAEQDLLDSVSISRWIVRRSGRRRGPGS